MPLQTIANHDRLPQTCSFSAHSSRGQKSEISSMGEKSGCLLWGCKAGPVCYLLQISTFPAFFGLLCLIILSSVLNKLPFSIMHSKIPLCFDLIRARVTVFQAHLDNCLISRSLVIVSKSRFFML